MKITLIKKIKETEDIYSFSFKPDEKIVWEAGKFIFLKIPHPHPDSRGDTRHFTISSAPYEKNILITSKFDFKNGSSFKKALLNLEEGSTIEAFNLRGKLIVKDPRKKYVFIAGGIGITPYRSILLDLVHKHESSDIILLYCCKEEEIIFKDVFEGIEDNYEWLKIHYIIEPQLISEKIIRDEVTDSQERIFYVSGPIIMVKIVEGFLSKLNIRQDRIEKDYFHGY